MIVLNADAPALEFLSYIYMHHIMNIRPGLGSLVSAALKADSCELYLLYFELVDGANRRHAVTEVQIIHLGSVILISVVLGVIITSISSVRPFIRPGATLSLLTPS